ncbi:GGDEF domain-containing protein [Paraglaciecola sp. L3A3]|uniref:GGDEF domain-containing protein n=1 Tax=Paraglaciecola sp. L3A3 TaxID=2686358 RepID=UPI00131AADBD|nr:GGDEF domain-containing protein [Paraglaciecola sp. L3A3]
MTKIATDNFTKLKIFAFMVTVALVLFYDYIPKRTLTIHPDLNSITIIYADGVEGGSTEFTWIDKNKSEWICNYKGGTPYPYCNIAISWSQKPYKQIDLSTYTHLNIDLEYEGNAEYIRIFLRNYYEYPGDIDEIKAGKFNTLTKPADFFSEVSPIYLDQLRVSDWWIDEFNVPPHLVGPDIRKVISLGLGIPNPAPLGQHKFHLKSIQAEGVYFKKELLYFSIIIFWSVLLIGEILFRYVRLNRKSQKYINLLSKVTEQSAIYKQKSETDKLTKILNREGLTQIIKQLDATGLLHEYAVMMLDLDHFKKINDNHGHAVGDSVLKDVADNINTCMRSYDLVARWGGEEFIVLFHCLNAADQYPFAERVRKKIEASNYVIADQERVTVSIGIAKMSKTESFEETFQKADKALYQAKEMGRNKSVIYSHE